MAQQAYTTATQTPAQRDLYRRYQFFREHAGYIVGRSAACAYSLVKAEQWLSATDIETVREPEQDPDLSWMTKAERERDHECEVFALVRPCPDHGVNCRHADWLASVGNVVDADTAYARVLFAELASDVMPTERKTS